MDLYESDSIKTGEDTSASIILFKSSIIRLDNNTEVTIGKLIQEVFEIITEDRETNMKGTYLYLYVIGVAPEHQGKGIGTHLINNMLSHLPPDIPIYLETETERNVKLYEKLGFKILKQIMVPSLQLPMWEMLYDRK